MAGGASAVMGPAVGDGPGSAELEALRRVREWARTGLAWYQEVDPGLWRTMPVRTDVEITLTPDGEDMLVQESEKMRLAAVRIGPSTDAPPMMYAAILSNILQALAKRHARLRGEPTEHAREMMRWLSGVLRELMCRGVERELQEKLGIEDWLARYPAPKERAYRREILERQVDAALGRTYDGSAVGIFAKMEKTANQSSETLIEGSLATATKPRGIQNPRPPQPEVGLEFYFAQTVLKHHVLNGEVFEATVPDKQQPGKVRKILASVKYSCTDTPEERAAWVLKHAGLHLFASDKAAFDGTFGELAADTVAHVFEPAFAKEVREWHKSCRRTRGTGFMRKDGKLYTTFKYKMGAQRRSGDWDTSSGNSTWNGLVEIACFADMGACEVHVLVLGDDCVVAVRMLPGLERPTNEQCVAAGVEYAMEVEPVQIAAADSPTWLRVDFCSQMIWAGPTGWTMAPKIWRSFAKFAWAFSHKQPKALLLEMRAASADALKRTANVPVLRALHGAFAPAHLQQETCGRSLEINRMLFSARYGLTAEQQIALEKQFLSDPLAQMPTWAGDALSAAENGKPAETIGDGVHCLTSVAATRIPWVRVLLAEHPSWAQLSQEFVEANRNCRQHERAPPVVLWRVNEFAREANGSSVKEVLKFADLEAAAGQPWPLCIA